MASPALYLVASFGTLFVLDIIQAHFERWTLPWSAIWVVQVIILFVVLGGAVSL